MKILLIDDHKLIKIGIKVLLEDNKDVDVIDDCSSKKEFLEKIDNETMIFSFVIYHYQTEVVMIY